MEVQEAFGLKRRHTYDEVVAWLNSDPKGVAYPSRVAYKTYNSPIYGQLKDSLRTFNSEATQGYLAHQRGEDGGAPYVPPRPRPFDNVPADPPPAPPDDDDDDLMGPPGAGPETYSDLLQPEPNRSDQILINEGMSPPPPPPPPAAPSMMQQAGSSFAQAAGGAMGEVAGSVAAGAASGLLARAATAAGLGATAGAEAGPAGVLGGAAIGAFGSLLSSAVSGAVARGFEPGGGSSSQPAGPPTTYGPGGLQVRMGGQPRNQETVNRQQRLHNQGSGTPAAQVDFRTLNGTNEQMRPRDRKVSTIAPVRNSRVGILGGQSGGSDGPMVVDPAAAQTRPAPGNDFGGTKIPRTADPAPMAAPSYNDLVGKLKQTKAPQIGPITPSRPRSRSPRRGDRRPLDVQRREEERAQRGDGILFPGGDGREQALARRSKTIPKNVPAKEFYIGDTGTKRSGTPGVEQLRQTTDTRKPRPNPAGGNQKIAGKKRKATSDPENPQATSKPPPRPQGRIGNTKFSKGDLKIGTPNRKRK